MTLEGQELQGLTGIVLRGPSDRGRNRWLPPLTTGLRWNSSRCSADRSGWRPLPRARQRQRARMTCVSALAAFRRSLSPVPGWSFLGERGHDSETGQNRHAAPDRPTPTEAAPHRRRHRDGHATPARKRPPEQRGGRGRRGGGGALAGGVEGDGDLAQCGTYMGTPITSGRITVQAAGGTVSIGRPPKPAYPGKNLRRRELDDVP